MERSVVEVVLVSLLSNAVVLGVIGYLSKSMFTHFLNKDIERFKSEILADASKQIESYKSKLEIERNRLQISYGGIFQRQAEVLIKLYGLLLHLEGVVNNGIRGAEAWNDYQSELDQLKAYYHENRALIPEKLDLLTNNAIMVGRAILSDALRDERSQDLVSNFRDAKEKCLAEIRKLLAVAVQNDS